MRGACRLYTLLEHAIDPTLLDEMEDEISYMMDNARDGTMQEAVTLMYDDPPDGFNPFETVLLFIQGIKITGFLPFVHFLKGFTNAK
jgi:hypothetical protein